MPFGKSNSAKIFCHWVSNWCETFRKQFGNWVSWKFVVESYIDDIFGGANSENEAAELKENLIATGNLTSAKMNLTKCHGPASKLTLLGKLFDSITESCRMCPKKQTKYISRLTKL